MKRKIHPIPTDDSILFRQICENANDIIQCVDTAGKFVYVNKKWLKTLGYSLQDSRRMTFVDILRKDQIPHCSTIFQNLMKDISSDNVETIFQSKSGQDIFVEGNIAPRYEGEKIIGGVGIFRDITIRKRVIEQLHKEKDHAQRLLDITTVMIVSIDRTGNVMLINKKGCEILEFKESDILGKNWFNTFIPKETKRNVKRIFESLLKEDSDKYQYVENPVVTKSRTERIIAWHNTVVRDNAGKITGTLSSGTDVTEYKRVEAELRNSQEKFRLLFEYAPDAYYLNDLSGTFVDGNKMAETITGYERDQLIGQNFFKLNLLPANQLPKAAALLGRNAMGKASGPDEFILNRRDGTQIFVEIRTYPLKMEGKTIVLGVARDITERRRVERELRESETRYKELVEKADVAIMLDDVKGNFKYFNKNFAELFGYTYSEMQSKSIEQLVHPDDMNKVARYHRERLKGMEIPKKYEFKGIRKDGTPLWVEVNVVVLEEGGKVIGTRAYIWDISERKGAEQELRTLSMVDELTGLYNRRGLHAFAEQQIKIADRIRKGFLLIFADIDHMKWINDNMGHKEGDQALKDAAAVLTESCRKSDIVARIGGDEFAVIAVDAIKNSESIVVGRILKNIALKNSKTGKKYQLSLSVGTAYYDPTTPYPLDELLEDADKKMYEYKKRKYETKQDSQQS